MIPRNNESCILVLDKFQKIKDSKGKDAFLFIKNNEGSLKRILKKLSNFKVFEDVLYSLNFRALKDT